jgi:cytochrome P450
MNANANNLCFWMILRILATPGLVDRIRAEVEPHAQASQPGNTLGLAEPPILKISLAGLRGECPLLKSCYFETLRLDSSPWSIRYITKDFTITEQEKDRLEDARSFALKAGEYVGIPSDVHQSDPRYFPSPESFMAERFLTQKPDGKVEADIGTLRPYGGGNAMCMGKLFAEGEVLAFVAGIVALWDFEPAGVDGWQIPNHARASGVTVPKTDIRVRIRRRKLP